DGRVGDDLVGDGGRGGLEPHLHGEGPAGPDGEAAEARLVVGEGTDELVLVGELETDGGGAGGGTGAGGAGVGGGGGAGGGGGGGGRGRAGGGAGGGRPGRCR